MARPRKSSARGGHRSGSGRHVAAALSGVQRAEARGTDDSATPQTHQANTFDTATASRTRSSATAGAGTNTDPIGLSPVSQARQNRQKPADQMTRAELEQAVHRAVQQRNYAWRSLRAITKRGSATSTLAAAPAMRQTTERPASDKAKMERCHRLFKALL
eukprot:5078534-Pleurochrysis_carterae.AAC.1